MAEILSLVGLNYIGNLGIDGTDSCESWQHREVREHRGGLLLLFRCIFSLFMSLHEISVLILYPYDLRH